MFNDSTDRGFAMVLRYAWDPVNEELVPVEKPETFLNGPAERDIERDPEETFLLQYSEALGQFEMHIEDFSGNEMLLQGHRTNDPEAFTLRFFMQR